MVAAQWIHAEPEHQNSKSSLQKGQTQFDEILLSQGYQICICLTKYFSDNRHLAENMPAWRVKQDGQLPALNEPMRND